ncbi:MAG TPA: hypothetical protein DDX85_11520 [Nitrospiraceae bacterium]|nr:hypothetical protein [Nitrospiraceae bacterium]
MRRWMKKFNNVMAAAAFAEAGEFETARQTLKEQRKILLALTGEKSDKNAFRYAVNVCKRIGAELEILHVSKIEKGLLKQFRADLQKEGIEHCFIQKNGSLQEEIQNHTDMKRDILFVVVEVSEGLNVNSEKSVKILSDAWNNLSCPLVVVSRNAMTSPAT